MPGCLTKEPLGPPDPPDNFFLFVEYEAERIDEPVLWGNFGCAWCDFEMGRIASELYRVDSLSVLPDADYICNIEDGPDRWAASSDGIYGIFRARTTKMEDFQVLTDLVPNNSGSFNFLIQIDEDGLIKP